MGLVEAIEQLKAQPEAFTGNVGSFGLNGGYTLL
jgi:hypothetical protein